MTDTNFGDPSNYVGSRKNYSKSERRHSYLSMAFPETEKVTGWKLMTPAQWDMFCYLRSNHSQSAGYYVRLIRQRV